MLMKTEVYTIGRIGFIIRQKKKSTETKGGLHAIHFREGIEKGLFDQHFEKNIYFKFNGESV